MTPHCGALEIADRGPSEIVLRRDVADAKGDQHRDAIVSEPPIDRPTTRAHAWRASVSASLLRFVQEGRRSANGSMIIPCVNSGRFGLDTDVTVSPYPIQLASRTPPTSTVPGVSASPRSGEIRSSLSE